MARIPEIVERPTPQPGRRLVAIHPQGDEAAQAVARTIGGIAAERQEKLDRFDTARAESAFLQGHSLAMRELTDDDYGTYQARYDKRMEETRKNAAGLIKTADTRNRFMQGTEQSLIRAREQVFQKAEGKRHDLNRSGLVELIDKNRQSALEAEDEGLRVAFLKNSQDAIDGARFQNSIDAESAMNLKKKVAEDYSVSRVEMLPYAEQIKALTEIRKPGEQTALVDFLPADKKAALLERAKTGFKVQQNQAETERKLRLAQSQIDAVNLIEAAGGDVRAVDPAVWATFPPSTRKSMMAYAEKLAEGVKITTDFGVYYDQRQLAADDPAEFASPDYNLAQFRDKLSDTDYKSLIDLQVDLRSKSAKESESWLGIRSQKDVVDGALRSMDIDPNEKDEDKVGRVVKFRQLVDAAVIEEEKKQGRRITSLEMDDIVGRLAVKGVLPDTGLFGFFQDEKFAFELGADEKFEVPEAERELIVDSLQRRGIPVTEESIYDLYTKSLTGGE